MTNGTEEPALSAAEEQLLRELTERAHAGGLKLAREGGLLGRPLDPVYAVVFADAIMVKIRQGQVANRLAHQNPTGWRMRTMWMRPGRSWWISRTLPT
jgi:hypothetical protein